MKASKMLIANYAFKALDILLPELESGLQDSFWRIRDSSLQLCGELLFRLAGISGRVTTSDDVGEDEDQETVGGDAASRKLTEILNRDRFHRLLSAMYALRQDVAGTVRLQSIQIWKGAWSTSSSSKIPQSDLPQRSCPIHLDVYAISSSLFCIIWSRCLRKIQLTWRRSAGGHSPTSAERWATKFQRACQVLSWTSSTRLDLP